MDFSVFTPSDEKTRRNPVWHSKDKRFRSMLIGGIGLICAVLVGYLSSHGNGLLALAGMALVLLVAVLIFYPFFGVILWLLVIPFVSVLPYSNLAYWAVYRIMPVFLLGIVMLSRIFKVRVYPPSRLGPPELALGILALVVPGSILLSSNDPGLALIRFGDRMILPFCLYLVARLTAPDEKEFRLLLWVALFTALSQSAIGFLSWYAPNVLPQLWHYLNGIRTTGSVKDPDLYGLLLVLSGILLIHGAVHTTSVLKRLILLAVTGLCAIFAFLSLERAVWLGGVLVTIGLIILYPQIMVRLIVIGTIVMVILGTGILSSHVALSVTRFSETDPVYDRLVVFDAMTQMVKLKPVLGWGYENLDANIQGFYRRVGEASIATRLVTSHNTYMTVLTELGVVGFVLYMFPVVWWLILTIRVWTRVPQNRVWGRSLLGALWLVMLCNFTVSNFFDMRWFPIGLVLWWLVLGLIANTVYPYLKGRMADSNALAQQAVGNE